MSTNPVRTSRVNITLPEDLRVKLEAIAAEKGTSPTTLASRIVSNWLDSYERNQTIFTLLSDYLAGTPKQ